MPWKHPLRYVVVALFALVATACARDATSPSAPPGPRLAVGAAGGAYIVLFNGNGVPADLGARVQALGGAVQYTHAGAGLVVVSGLTAQAAAALAKTSGVATVEPDVEIALDDRPGVPEAVPLDAAQSVANPAGALLFSRQWDMRDILAPAAWSAGKFGSSGVTVAILDTGLDYDDLDLNGLVDLSRSTSFIASDNTLTATFFPTRNPVNDYNGHGTNVAATVSSTAFVFAGVTSKTRLMGVKVLGASGRSAGSSVLEGVLYAADHGADVANMSLGGGFAKAALGQAVASVNRVFNYANSKGMLIVVAAGNSSADLDHDGNTFSDFCSAPHVICVSANGALTAADLGTPAQDVPAFYTNFGRSAISVAAPGGNATLDAAGHVVFASWVWSLCAKFTLAGFTTAGAPILAGCQSGNFITGFIGTGSISNLSTLAGISPETAVAFLRSSKRTSTIPWIVSCRSGRPSKTRPCSSISWLSR